MRKLTSVIIAVAGVGVALAAYAAPSPPAASPSVKGNPAPAKSPPLFGALELHEVMPGATPPGPSNLENPPPKPEEPKPYTTSYAGAGELRYEVEVLNKEKEVRTAGIRVTSGQRLVARTLVRLPAASAMHHGKASVEFKDEVPFDPCGEGAVYQIEVEGTDMTKTIRTKNDGCSFKVTTVDPSASVPPDTRAAQRANKIYAGSPSVSFAGRCLVPFTVNATVKNGTTSNVTGAKLKIDGPAGAVGLGPAFNVAQGATTNATVGLPSFKVGLGAYKLSLETNAPKYESGWYAKVAIDKCTLKTAWEK